MTEVPDLLVRGFAGYSSLLVSALILTLLLRHLYGLYAEKWLRYWTWAAAALTLYFAMAVVHLVLTSRLAPTGGIRVLHTYTIQLSVYGSCTLFLLGGAAAFGQRALSRRAAIYGAGLLFVIPALLTALIPWSTDAAQTAFFISVSLPRLVIGSTAVIGSVVTWQVQRRGRMGMNLATGALLALGLIQFYLVYLLEVSPDAPTLGSPFVHLIQFWEVLAFVLFGLGLVLWTLEQERDRLARTMARLRDAQEDVRDVERIKAALLRNLRHEIRTPLTGILGYVDLLREDDPPVRMVADAVEENGKRLYKLLTDLLDLALYEANVRDEDDADAVRIATLVEAAVEDWRPRAEEQGLRLVANVQTGGARGQVDADGLRRILDQLLSNAVKFTAAGQVTISAASEPEEVVIDVCDTGPGIPPEYEDRLFEAFTQASQGLDRDHEGMGLGLTLAQKIARLIGVTLSVDSEADEGSCFRITIPRARSAEPVDANTAV